MAPLSTLSSPVKRFEEIGLVEFENEAVLVGNLALVRVIPDPACGNDGLHDLAPAMRIADERPAQIERGAWHDPPHRLPPAAARPVAGLAADGVEIAAKAGLECHEFTEGADMRKLPADFARHPAGIETLCPGESENARIGKEERATRSAIARLVTADPGGDHRNQSLVVILAKPLKAVDVEGKEIGSGVLLDERTVFQNVFAAEIVTFEIGIIAGKCQIEAERPVLIEIVAALALDMSAPDLSRIAVGIRFGIGCAGDAATECRLAERMQLAIFRAEECPLARGDERQEGEIAIRCYIDEERRLCGQTEFGIGAEARREKARLALDRRIGMEEIGQPRHRHTEDLEPGVAIGDGPALLIVDHPVRLDLP